MTSKNIPADIKNKSIKETKEEINKILEKIEKVGANLESYTNDYDRLLKLNKHIDELFEFLHVHPCVLQILKIFRQSEHINIPPNYL